MTGFAGGDDRRLRVEHLLDAVRAHRGTRREHRDERRHHHRHQDLDEVAEERDQRADLHLAGCRCGSPPIQIAATLDTLSTSIDGREHERHQPAGAQRRHRELVVGVAEALGFVGLADERAHDADAGDLLAQDLVDAVDALLHHLELRHHPR